MMKWKNKNPDLHTVAEVVFRNTGMSEKEMEEIKEYSIHRMKEVADLIKYAKSAFKKGREKYEAILCLQWA